MSIRELHIKVHVNGIKRFRVNPKVKKEPTPMLCSNADCRRFARHWVRVSRVSPNKRHAICHRCLVNLNFPTWAVT